LLHISPGVVLKSVFGSYALLFRANALSFVTFSPLCLDLQPVFSHSFLYIYLAVNPSENNESVDYILTSP
jgi:hypothetical protein